MTDISVQQLEETGGIKKGPQGLPKKKKKPEEVDMMEHIGRWEAKKALNEISKKKVGS